MGKKVKEPFWESSYRDSSAASVFGSVSDEIHQLLPKLPTGAEVLDLGCGDGRNAIFLLKQGMSITAVDISTNAITKLKSQAGQHGNRLKTEILDVRSYRFTGQFDLIIAHGLLHLLPRSDWTHIMKSMQEYTKPSGFNIVAVFSDVLPPPEDRRPFTLGLFHEGELKRHYIDWNIVLYSSFILEDEHPGNIRHRHPVNKIVAQKPEDGP